MVHQKARTLRGEKNPYHECEDSWCIYKINPSVLTAIVKEVKNITSNVHSDKKRFYCYQHTAKSVLRNVHLNERRHLGWCFEYVVRKAFPDDRYMGYKNVNYFQTNQGERSSDESVVYHQKSPRRIVTLVFVTNICSGK